MLFGGPPQRQGSSSPSNAPAEKIVSNRSFFSLQSPAVEAVSARRAGDSSGRGRDSGTGASSSTVGEDDSRVYRKRLVRSHSPGYGQHDDERNNNMQLQNIRQESTIDTVHEEQYRLQARHEFMQDLATVVKAVKASEPQQAPQPIIIQNHATSASQAQATAPKVDEDERRLRRREPESPLLAFLRSMFGNRVNRFFMFSTVGLSFYLVHQWMQHNFRTVEMQKKIDANIVMRMSQWMSKQLEKNTGGGGGGFSYI